MMLPTSKINRCQNVTEFTYIVREDVLETAFFARKVNPAKNVVDSTLVIHTPVIDNEYVDNPDRKKGAGT